ncbi:DUF4282 domain-containing protein [Glaciimonas sp. PAMC28666]|uniref:DUF4282 domain-containing protein n=1 Tax=Glaciimonas sp. PAMC28666 TaxID=2807626 RepID=UPI0019660763|nr:DUF4282 domain-containing protein [Glaciimonas sp. PAMC28666]QRX83025.1 DUF4282 domain-containing protein [Glaciimonas sp. PAMC28666]
MTTKKNYLKFSALLGFEHLIAPYLITLIYRVGIVVIVAGGTLSSINNGGAGGSIGRALLGIGGTLLALLLWRVMSELWIVVFSIFQRLGDIRDQLVIRNNASKKVMKNNDG